MIKYKSDSRSRITKKNKPLCDFPIIFFLQNYFGLGFS